MEAFDWGSVYLSSNDCYDEFIKHVKIIFESSFPLVTLSRKRLYIRLYLGHF